jgi:hypothetical protein
MAVTLLVWQAKEAELVAQLGVAAVRFGERSIQYADTLKSLELVQGKITALGGTTLRRTVVRTVKGW